MRIRNSTEDRTLTIQTEFTTITLRPQETSVPIRGDLGAIQLVDSEGSGLQVVLPGEVLVGGTDEDDRPDTLDDGTDEDDRPDTLDDGTDEDDRPDTLDDGTGADGEREPAVEIVNSTAEPLRLLFERTLPVEKAFRIIGELGTVDISGTEGDVSVTLSARR